MSRHSQSELNAIARRGAHTYQLVVLKFYLDRGFNVYGMKSLRGTRLIWLADNRTQVRIEPDGEPVEFSKGSGSRFDWETSAAKAKKSEPFPHIAFQLASA